MNLPCSPERECFLCGLWHYSELWRRDTRWCGVLTGLLLRAALLCRLTYLLRLVPLVLELFLKRCRTSLDCWFIALVAIAGLFQTAHNTGSFGPPFDFGQASSRQGLWED